MFLKEREVHIKLHRKSILPIFLFPYFSFVPLYTHIKHYTTSNSFLTIRVRTRIQSLSPSPQVALSTAASLQVSLDTPEHPVPLDGSPGEGSKRLTAHPRECRVLQMQTSPSASEPCRGRQETFRKGSGSGSHHAHQPLGQERLLTVSFSSS